ncbi:snRNA-activating protein complex subunit 4 isoform X2 [Rana temporaria]|uniref:snRNA-activating protein complex subunit 4 isoform X2 n=1 Tax=Rana temporaria TaxID=8407 RepID=UPI001AAD121A|nr:snRNA-activating protein complex subunit 4 isoform X2 [Rana temporaria]
MLLAEPDTALLFAYDYPECHSAAQAVTHQCMQAGTMAAFDLKAEKDKIQREIEALERSLGPNAAALSVDVSDSDDSDDDLEEQFDGDCQTDDVAWEDGGSSAEMCLQMNLVYQAVIEEKLQELEVLIAQNKEQQEELMWELAGRKTQRAGTNKLYPLNLALGHFMKPYFKDKVSGLGPPANQEMKERSLHIVKAFNELVHKNWKPTDDLELKKAIFSDTLQKMLQPKMLKIEYLQQKYDNTKNDIEKKILTKQIQEAESEMDDINQLKEDVLLGQRTDSHDWDKISNINFEGVHTPERLCNIWHNYEHPHINKEVWTEAEIEKLKEIAMAHNFVDWQVIAQELGTQRTAFQCLQTFQRNNKAFKRSEFTKEEDEMLKHFVQRMRVGEHIPYKKISYFMEGRDGLQLLYRWTKCLDPSLRKGPWTKEEDEMLLKAVAKYGERWYKIRFDVPGRSDVQCRERYVKGLRKDIKKGRWDTEEKDKLVELTAKYGVGHWAEVCKGVPNRTSSQCLSKWKHLIGYFKGRVRKKKPRLKRLRKKNPPKSPKPQKPPKANTIKKEMASDEEISIDSSSSSSESIVISSSESEDEAMELMDQFGEGEISSLLQSVPDLDLWIPRKRSPGLQGKNLHVYSAASNNKKPPRTKKKRKESTFKFNTILKGIAYPPSTDTVTETVEDFLKEEEKKEHEILQILEEDLIKILMRNTQECERKQIQRIMPPSDSDGNQHKDSSTSLSQLAVTRLYKASVDRKLLCAVTRWVGNVFLPISTNRGRGFRGRTWADEVNKKLSCVTMTSTPIFTLLIQYFQIDAEGCLQMIQQRKREESEFFKRVKNSTKKTARKMSGSAPLSPKSILVQSFNDQKPNPVVSQITTEITSPPLQKCRRSKSTRVRSDVPAPKMKTVSELLREKRMQKKIATKTVQSTSVLSGNILVLPQFQHSVNPTVQPQTMVLPVSPTTSQNNSWPIRPFSPVPTCQVVTNNSSFNRMSLVSGGPISRLVAGPTGNVPVPQNANVQRNVQNRLSGMPPSPQPLPNQIIRAVSPAPNFSALPMTILITPQGLISIPTQALPTLTQQSGNQSPRIVSTTLNTAATGPFVTESSNSSFTNAPSKSLYVPAQPLPATTSSKTEQSIVTSSSIVNFPQASGNQLTMLVPCETSRKPFQILPAVASRLSQDGTVVASSVGSLPQMVDSHLPTIAPIKVSKMSPVAVPTITSSLSHEDVAATSNSSPLVAEACLSKTAPSDFSKMLSQTLPPTTSSLRDKGTKNALVESQPQLTDSCLPTLTPSSASNTGLSSSLTQVDATVFSQDVSEKKEACSHLPILALSKPSAMLSQMVPVTSSSKQEGISVASLVTSQTQPESTLPKVALSPGLPDKASQLKLTPQKYPIVKLAKLLPTNLSREEAANVTSDPQRNPVSNISKRITNSQKILDFKLISLEEETSVKEWLQGKQGVEVPKQTMTIPYLPPSICTLKTFSRLLLEKKTLEENAFKLLPFSDITEVGSPQMQATVCDMVEEGLKDNLAYQLIKQRFLSAFTIPGFLAVLPPTHVSSKQEDSDEDIEDLMNSETTMVEATHKGNHAAAEGDSSGNISEKDAPMLAEQETALICSTENSSNIDNTERIVTRRSVYCRPVT